VKVAALAAAYPVSVRRNSLDRSVAALLHQPVHHRALSLHQTLTLKRVLPSITIDADHSFYISTYQKRQA
jgi:hypothetical protein